MQRGAVTQVYSPRVQHTLPQWAYTRIYAIVQFKLIVNITSCSAIQLQPTQTNANNCDHEQNLTSLPPRVQRSPLRCWYNARVWAQLVRFDSGSHVNSNIEYPCYLTRYSIHDEWPRPWERWLRISSTLYLANSSAAGWQDGMLAALAVEPS